MLNLADLSDVGVNALCQSVVRASSEISVTWCTVFAEQCLLPRVSCVTRETFVDHLTVVNTSKLGNTPARPFVHFFSDLSIVSKCVEYYAEHPRKFSSLFLSIFARGLILGV